ncbi:MAG: hypothetical protein ACI8ZB_000626 [Desulforhopalus sp.]|jgi:hypothetical protein
MMTPVYDVKKADWKTNSYNIFPYAVRPENSAISTTNSITTGHTRSTEKNLFACHPQHLSRQSCQRFQSPTSETTQFLARVKKTQSKRKLSVIRNPNSKQSGIRSFSHSNLYSFEVTPSTAVFFFT